MMYIICILSVVYSYVKISLTGLDSNLYNVRLLFLLLGTIQVIMLLQKNKTKNTGIVFGTISSFGLMLILYYGGAEGSLLLNLLFCISLIALYTYDYKFEEVRGELTILVLLISSLNYSILTLYNSVIINSYDVVAFINIMLYYVYTRRGGWKFDGKQILKGSIRLKK